MRVEASRGALVSLLDLGSLLAVPTHVDAPCLDGAHDWHADGRRQRALAAERCAGCPILDECLSAALDRGEQWGVWGGVDLETALRLSPAADVRNDLRSSLDARGGALTA